MLLNLLYFMNHLMRSLKFRCICFLFYLFSLNCIVLFTALLSFNILFHFLLRTIFLCLIKMILINYIYIIYFRFGCKKVLLIVLRELKILINLVLILVLLYLFFFFFIIFKLINKRWLSFMITK